jgi:hypothetical protein
MDDWQLIALSVGNGRTKSQCRQHWTRGLDQKICKEQWPSGQDERLIELVIAFSEKSWTCVAAELGNRCDVQCRYRYKQLQKEPGFDERMAAAAERAPVAGDPERTESQDRRPTAAYALPHLEVNAGPRDGANLRPVLVVLPTDPDSTLTRTRPAAVGGRTPTVTVRL